VSAGRAGSRPSRGVAALAGGARTDSSDGEHVSQHCLSREWGRIRRDLRADSPATAAVLGRSRPGAARSDQRLGRRARGLLRGPERASPRDHHPSVWQRRHGRIPTSSAGGAPARARGRPGPGGIPAQEGRRASLV